MAFLNIVPKSKRVYNRTIGYKYHTIQDSIPLRVVLDDGVDMSPDVKIKVTDLSKGQKHFVNASGDGDVFNVTVLINDKDRFSDAQEYWHMEAWTDQWGYTTSKARGGLYKDTYKVAHALDNWIRKMTVMLVTSDDKDALMPDGEYIITDNPHRVQNYRDGYSLWELEFTKYTGVVTSKYSKVSAAATKAIKKYKEKKAKAKASSSLNNKLKKCKVSQLKYSKKKKAVDCVKTLQTYLNKKKFGDLKVDGWYGDATLKAVKRFQEKYKGKYKLSVNGKMDSKTLSAMLKV